MIELQTEYKPYFYIASVLLGVQVVFFLNFISSPTDGWLLYGSVIALSGSVPLLVGACVGAITGYLEPLQHLLRAGALLFIAWFILALMSYSIVAGVVFLFVSLLSFKMLQYHHVDQKASEN